MTKTNHERHDLLEAPPWARVEAGLMSVARLLREAYDDLFASLDLNLTTASMLAYVSDFGPVRQTKIADHLGHGRAATGASIDRLEAMGLVERLPDPDDRRVWNIALTPEGAEVLPQVMAIDERLRSDLRAGIGRPERQQLGSILSRLETNLRDAAVNNDADRAS